MNLLVKRRHLGGLMAAILCTALLERPALADCEYAARRADRHEIRSGLTNPARCARRLLFVEM